MRSTTCRSIDTIAAQLAIGFDVARRARWAVSAGRTTRAAIAFDGCRCIATSMMTGGTVVQSGSMAAATQARVMITSSSSSATPPPPVALGATALTGSLNTPHTPQSIGCCSTGVAAVANAAAATSRVAARTQARQVASESRGRGEASAAAAAARAAARVGRRRGIAPGRWRRRAMSAGVAAPSLLPSVGSASLAAATSVKYTSRFASVVANPPSPSPPP